MHESNISESSPQRKKKKHLRDSNASCKSPERSKKFIDEDVISYSPKKRKDTEDNKLESRRKKSRDDPLLDVKQDFEYSDKDPKTTEGRSETVKDKKNKKSEVYEYPWSREEVLCLIGNVRQALQPGESAYYMKSLTSLDWDSIACEDRSADDCKQKLMTILKKLNKYKSLTTLMTEAESLLHMPDSVMPARDRFVREFLKHRRNKDNSLGKDALAEANAEWAALSLGEREKYEAEYREENEEQRKLQDLPPSLPRIPIAIYIDLETEKMKNKSIVVRKKLSKMFNELDLEDKIPFIHKSITEYAHYIDAVKAYKKSHRDWENSKQLRIPHTLFQEYLDYLGMPKYKANSFAVFAEDMKKEGKFQKVFGRDRLKYLTELYKNLPVDKKNKLYERGRNSRLQYGENFNSWLEKQVEAVAVVAEAYYKQKIICGNPIGAFSNVIEMSLGKPKFKEEPEKPLSAFHIFSKKFDRKSRDKYNSKEERRRDCLAAWKNLPEEAKMTFIIRAKHNMETFKENLLDYVRNLGEGTGVYLGCRRAEYFKYFKKDIFEAEYPNDQYPVFQSPKLKSKLISTNKEQPKNEKSTRESDTDENSGEDAEDEVRKETVPGKSSYSDSKPRASVKNNNEDESSSVEEGSLPAWNTPQHLSHKVEIKDKESTNEEEEEEEEKKVQSDNDGEDEDSDDEDEDSDDEDEDSDDEDENSDDDE
ncbi:hypothetical protein SK128_028550 [Halocaridina rubra]|uniref:HMG box domain-containing protein n=1 Tax=Halocaridina rubra TaxID=373956 RepID=A0AAN8ZUD9_HALRR